MKSEKDIQTELAELLLTRAALRALLMSHPDVPALRGAWNYCVSMAWSDLTVLGKIPPGMQEMMRKYQDVLETYFPDSPQNKG